MIPIDGALGGHVDRGVGHVGGGAAVVQLDEASNLQTASSIILPSRCVQQGFVVQVC